MALTNSQRIERKTKILHAICLTCSGILGVLTFCIIYWLADHNYIPVDTDKPHVQNVAQKPAKKITRNAVVKLEDGQYVKIDYSGTCQVKFERAQIVQPEARP